MKDMMVLAKLRRGNYSLVVEKISPGSLAIGRSILDLQLPDSSVIAALVREDKVVMPRGKTIFEVGDEIYAITDAEGEENLQNIFAGPLTTKNGR
jgi:trk system potassium uptake protein TrkA